ncbi:protein Mabiki [Drosophila albomicans]|uniref:Protein Mabiki n=2 Tax=nasuta subgroup TaxID=32307 RepID=A0A9C6W935_DROAB|nr:protein Mabiki [Drosophila albomicans]
MTPRSFTGHQSIPRQQSKQTINYCQKIKNITFIMQSYRHKKFDMKVERRLETNIDLVIKRELLSRSSHLEDEDTSSQCSSNYTAPLLKRRRLNSTICDNSIGSESASSSHSLPNTISSEKMRDICKYHGNMVRKFPKKERSPKDQDRRNKNTIACRTSRRVKKLEHLVVEEQYKEFKLQHLKVVEQSMRAQAYFKHLSEMVKIDQTASPVPAKAQVAVPHKNFSIDYIINGIKGEQC